MNSKLLLLATALAAIAPGLHAKAPGDFPRLLGMNIGKKHYDDPKYQAELARLDVVIVGFFPGWNPRHESDPIGSFLRNVKRINPAIKIGQYTILNESYDNPGMSANLDVTTAVTENKWWVRNAAGEKVQWTPRYRTWEINCTQWAPTNSSGQRYSDWRAERDNRIFFAPHPGFDLWYVDNVMVQPRVTADWDLDGKNDDRKDPRIQAAYREGMAHFWTAIRKVQPALPIMGNTDSDLSSPEFRGKLDGAFLEGWMGKSWSIEKQKGWSAAMDLYRRTRANLPEGAILGVNVADDVRDFRFFRYAFASCLMDDGYFSFADSVTLYSTVAWFDEYGVPLGKALTPPPHAAWQHGVWRRDFAGGVVLLNPTDSPVTITLEAGFHRFRGQATPEINNGEAVAQIILAPNDGILLVRDR